MNLETIADYLDSAGSELWPNDVPDTLDDATRATMYDQLVAHINTAYAADACVRDALVESAGQFFTGEIPAGDEKRDLSVIEDAASVDLLEARWPKIKCKMCKKLVKKIVGLVKDILTNPTVAAATCDAVSTYVGGQTAPPVGTVVEYVCLKQAGQLQKHAQTTTKLASLRRGGARGDCRGSRGPKCIKAPESVAK